MSPRTPTLPPTDGAMWRKLLARVHPDAGGTHELFIWTGAVKAVVCGGELQAGTGSPPPRRSSPPDETPRVPYQTGADFDQVTRRAVSRAEEESNIYAVLLGNLRDCHSLPNYACEQERGASYKRLAAIAHMVGMTKEERVNWYRLAESIPLADRHAGHLIWRLKSAAA